MEGQVRNSSGKERKGKERKGKGKYRKRKENPEERNGNIRIYQNCARNHPKRQHFRWFGMPEGALGVPWGSLGEALGHGFGHGVKN